MAKTSEEKLLQRLAQIKELIAQRDAIDVKLKKLTGIDTDQNKTSVPDDFNTNDEILLVFKEQNRPLKVATVVNELQKKFGVIIKPQNIQSAVYYLSKGKNPKLKKLGKGLFEPLSFQTQL